MAFSNRLCNPTHQVATIHYHAGISIVIPADGHCDLSAAQAEDYAPGKPGSESIREELDQLGVFLRDHDLPYEVQALEALKRAIRLKKAQYDNAVMNLQKRRAEAGISNDTQPLDETLEALGYARLARDISKLRERASFLERSISSDQYEEKANEIDPDRTLVFVSPPKVFESPLALQMFLNDPENSELKEKYDAWRTEFDSVERESSSSEA